METASLPAHQINHHITLPKSLQVLFDSGLLAKFLSLGDGHCVLYCRHSDRPKLAAGSAGFTISLTEQGVQRARLLGATLKGLVVSGTDDGATLQPGRMLCSTITRTAQTLSAIADGAGWNLDSPSPRVEMDDRILGRGTLFEQTTTLDQIMADMRANKAGLLAGIRAEHDVYNNLIAASCGAAAAVPYQGFRPFDDAFRDTLSVIVETLDWKPPKLASAAEVGSELETSLSSGGSDGPRLSVIVGHDFPLAVLLGGLYGMTRFTKEDWPPFLDSILFAKRPGTKNGIVAVYGDRAVEYA